MQTTIHNSNLLMQQYKEAVDISSIVTKTDPDGKITYVNDWFTEISGYSADELIGKSHNVISHPDTPPELFQDLWNTIQSKKTWIGTITNLSKDGSPYTVSATIVPIIDKNENITEYIAIRQDITELLKQKDIINRQTTDQLTQLPNREKLIEDLTKAQNPSLALINVNNFRDINELYGFEIGDEVLIKISQIITEYLKGSVCSLFKLPSDAFAVIQDSQKDIYYFEEFMIKLVEHLKQTDMCINTYKISISVTIGISNETINTLMHADIALQNAKRVKKPYILHSETSKKEEELQLNLIWHNKIKEAIDDNKIVIYYQPIYNTLTNKIQKYESLVRMIDTNEDIISPYLFLNIAKKYYQYEHITRIVIRDTLEYFKDKPYEFSINLSVEDIINDSTVAFIIDSIKNFIDPTRIIFEITESEGIENYEEVQTFIKSVKKFGCKIAIDDFGTGYSNFEYILKLNVDYLKIDGSLVKNIDKNLESRIVVETIILFAKKLGISTITEFVHNEEIFEIVKELGSDYIQGYYIGEPKENVQSDKEQL